MVERRARVADTFGALGSHAEIASCDMASGDPLLGPADARHVHSDCRKNSMVYKQTSRVTCILMALSMQARVCKSDGLIYKLPAEGIWARYEELIKVKVKGTLTSQAIDPKSVEHEFTRTLTVKSLNRVHRHDQWCRWIEIVSESEPGDVPPQPKRVLKLLVPEEYLKRGEDPLSHAIKTFFSPSPMDRSVGYIRSNIHEGFNRVQYEIERVRPVFHKPLKNVVSKGRETLEVHGHQWENCEVMTGTSHLDGTLSADGRMVFDDKCRVALHADAPFGIVSLDIVSDGIEYSRTVTAMLKSVRKITLVEVGRGAKSSLQPMEAVEAKAGLSANPQGNSSKKPIKAQPKDSLPQIQELDRILQTQDGDALRKFVLLGSPAWQKAVDNQVREIETKKHSVIDIVSTHVDRTFVRIGCRLTIDGKPLGRCNGQFRQRSDADHSRSSCRRHHATGKRRSIQ